MKVLGGPKRRTFLNEIVGNKVSRVYFMTICIYIQYINIYMTYFGKSLAFVIPDIRTQTRFKKTYLFMIYERFRRYSHLPHQVANNGINCYDAKVSKYNFFNTIKKLCIYNMYIYIYTYIKHNVIEMTQ